jgi:hypothetical protein
MATVEQGGNSAFVYLTGSLSYALRTDCNAPRNQCPLKVSALTLSAPSVSGAWDVVGGGTVSFIASNISVALDQTSFAAHVMGASSFELRNHAAWFDVSGDLTIINGSSTLYQPVSFTAPNTSPVTGMIASDGTVSLWGSLPLGPTAVLHLGLPDPQ